MTRLGVSVSRWYVAVCVAAICLVVATQARAQTRDFMLRGFADVGSTAFAAAQSFKAVLGSARGPILGGGVEAVLPQRIFVNLRASRFRGTGQRVFLFGGEQFGLGIPTTITMTPLELAGGYRVDYGWRVVPYGGAGIGWYRYDETSQFAEGSENVTERFQGFHVLGGAEIRLVRWIGAAIEVQWATVPDALGSDPNSVSREFRESNLGGTTIRVKVVVGR
jgi:opacity protein-like surface antigen